MRLAFAGLHLQCIMQHSTLLMAILGLLSKRPSLIRVPVHSLGLPCTPVRTLILAPVHSHGHAPLGEVLVAL